MVYTGERHSHRGARRRGSRGRRRHPHAPRARSGGDIARGIVRGIGELLFTAGLLMLFFAAYEVYGKQFETDREQDQLAQGLEDQWEQQEARGPDSEPLPGSANSRLYIPELDLQWVVVNGVSQEDIRYSPGHYGDDAVSGGDATAAGQRGNYAVAGHRTPGIFWDLDLLENGDEIVVEDADNFYTYEVIEERTVTPDQVEVVDPDPFDPENNEDPQRSLLTLTTCAPRLNNTHRLIIHAELTDTRPKDEGMPENIADMAPETQAAAGE
ncbi:class E sortase [Streptomonospora nanhaiensis]|uniref:Sortase A n=1 Tax=Streptomonospora nanhaiensis TaxID=1323731 RepID=A0A853BMA6_9ACTN|nr:class E sortase [Streptomonospora nanhaiensis]MBV2366663.1 class E sortase [Streptomonospora nanhaiensis]MBX9389221.1 class E sortase [Streptomonospora nanhaiensis]NYI95835.1 sortase A [Streptomonospora nanhaiensis]